MNAVKKYSNPPKQTANITVQCHGFLILYGRARNIKRNERNIGDGQLHCERLTGPNKFSGGLLAHLYPAAPHMAKLPTSRKRS